KSLSVPASHMALTDTTPHTDSRPHTNTTPHNDTKDVVRVTLADSPLAKFFTKFNCAKYTYSYLPCNEEFDKLTKNVTQRQWYRQKPRSTKLWDYWKSDEHRDLKLKFHETVEAQF